MNLTTTRTRRSRYSTNGFLIFVRAKRSTRQRVRPVAAPHGPVHGVHVEPPEGDRHAEVTIESNCSVMYRYDGDVATEFPTPHERLLFLFKISFDNPLYRLKMCPRIFIAISVRARNTE